MAAATILEPPFSELQAALNKKATFESACSQLASQPDVLAAGSEGRALVARARTLLRSRCAPPAAALRRLAMLLLSSATTP